MGRLPDELRADRGGGKPSPRARRELKELRDGTHPRQSLSPSIELEIADERRRLADDDLNRTAFDSEVHPRPPDGTTEATTDRDGTSTVDIQRDTENVGVELGPTGRDIFFDGLEMDDDLFTLDLEGEL
jgi:hypothetical protein